MLLALNVNTASCCIATQSKNCFAFFIVSSVGAAHWGVMEMREVRRVKLMAHPK